MDGAQVRNESSTSDLQLVVIRSGRRPVEVSLACADTLWLCTADFPLCFALSSTHLPHPQPTGWAGPRVKHAHPHPPCSPPGSCAPLPPVEAAPPHRPAPPSPPSVHQSLGPEYLIPSRAEAEPIAASLAAAVAAGVCAMLLAVALPCELVWALSLAVNAGCHRRS